MGKREKALKKALIQQLVTKVIVTPITKKVCTLGHLVTPGTDICVCIRDITPCGKGEGLGKRCRQYPGPLLYPLIFLVSENPVCRKPGFRELISTGSLVSENSLHRKLSFREPRLSEVGFP